jgi:hypothetical protein
MAASAAPSRRQLPQQHHRPQGQAADPAEHRALELGRHHPRHQPSHRRHQQDAVRHGEADDQQGVDQRSAERSDGRVGLAQPGVELQEPHQAQAQQAEGRLAAPADRQPPGAVHARRSSQQA